MVAKDIAPKHEKMRGEPLRLSARAPIWRWAETILEVCPDLADAPAVLAVGDIHLENFGTWRDADGRLVWGVNDFDEAARCPMRWTSSGWRRAPCWQARRGVAPRPQMCAAILDGLRRGPRSAQADRARPRLGLAARAGGRPPTSSAPSSGSKIEEAKHTPAPAPYRKALADAMPQAASRHVDRAPDRRHRQPRTAALDRRCRLARRARSCAS